MTSLMAHSAHRRPDQLTLKVLRAGDVAKPLEDQDADGSLRLQRVVVLLEGERDELLGLLALRSLS